MVALRSLFVASTLLCAVAASSTTVVSIGLDELARASAWIVRAEVNAVRAVDLRDQKHGILTDVELTVHEVIAGEDVPARYTLRLPGGQGADGVTYLIPGMPRFEVGEEVVLFLEATSLGHIPTGLGQGVWRLSTTATGATLATPDVAHVRLVKRGSSGIEDARSGLVAMPLSDLKAEVLARRAALHGGGK